MGYPFYSLIVAQGGLEGTVTEQDLCFYVDYKQFRSFAPALVFRRRRFGTAPPPTQPQKTVFAAAVFFIFDVYFSSIFIIYY